MSQQTRRAGLLAVTTLLVFTAALQPAGAFAAPDPAGGGNKPRPAVSGPDASRPAVMENASEGASGAPTGRVAGQAAQLPARGPVTALPPGVGGPRTSGPQHEVFGFAGYWALADPSTGYQSWNYSDLTTVAYFGLHINRDDGALVQGDSAWNIWHSGVASDFINRAHANGVRVILSLNYFDDGPGMCTALEHNATTIQQAGQHILGADGINLDYEGSNQVCPSGGTLRSELNGVVHNFRAAGIGAQQYLALDTYAIAPEGAGFFDIGSLQDAVNAFFVMDYDMDIANGPCGICLGAVAPVGNNPQNAYPYNVTRSANDYQPWAGKVILGFPYYGRAACVAGPNPPPNAPLVSQFGSEPYLDFASYPTDPIIQSWTGPYRDGLDPAGQEPWAWYYSGYPTRQCWREAYWDDSISLGNKYNLVVQRGFQGAGIFTLDYGGGAPELWATLCGYFSIPVITATIAAAQSNTLFNLSFTPTNGPCSVTGYDVQQRDTGLGQGWLQVYSNVAATNVLVSGYPGHNYEFQVRPRTVGGYTGAFSAAVATAVDGAATYAHLPFFKGLYVMDGYGGIHGASSPPLGGGPYWPGWPIARSARALPGASTTPQGGLMLDGLGGFHPFGSGVSSVSGGAFFGWDIARDLAFLPDGSGGYTLDGFGGLHPFGVNGHPAPPGPNGADYFGFDIARQLVIFSDGSGGYVLDGWGGVHPFGIASPSPPRPYAPGYWPGWNIARGLALVPGSHSGYVLDGYGGLHPLSAPGDPGLGGAAPPYFGWDIARGIYFTSNASPGQPSGYTLDGYGGLHPFAGAPGLSPTDYWPGLDVIRTIFGG